MCFNENIEKLICGLAIHLLGPSHTKNFISFGGLLSQLYFVCRFSSNWSLLTIAINISISNTH